jgi:hypothetical protein
MYVMRIETYELGCSKYKKKKKILNYFKNFKLRSEAVLGGSYPSVTI